MDNKIFLGIFNPARRKLEAVRRINEGVQRLPEMGWPAWRHNGEKRGNLLRIFPYFSFHGILQVKSPNFCVSLLSLLLVLFFFSFF